MNYLKNNKFQTISLIFLGFFLAGVNFLIVQGLSFDNNTTADMQKALKLNPPLAQASTVLPDIKKSDPIAKSAVRDSEINKIKPQLPVNAADEGFTIVYYDKSKILMVEVRATSLDQYRQRKLLAEDKLSQMGSTNICNLVVVWAPPASLNRQVTKSDLTTTSCP